MPRKQRSDAGVKRGPFKTKRRTTVDMMNAARNRPRRTNGTFTALGVCKRGHLRTPDNVNSSNNCKLCKRAWDAERRRRLGKVPRVEHKPSEPDPFGWWHPNRRRSA